MFGGDWSPFSVVNRWITQRPVTVVAVFLLLTLVFAGGLADVSTDPSVDAFTEDLPEQQALEQVNEEFEPPFEDDDTSVQVIQRGDNVLSRQSLIRMLELQHRLETHSEIDVKSVTSIAESVAVAVDPDAETTEERLRALEGATDSEVRDGVRLLIAEQPQLARILSDDLNEEHPRASATLTVVEHTELQTQDDEMKLVEQVETVADSVATDVYVFSGAIIEDEFERAMVDSLTMVIPVVGGLILLFLIVAYRDPIDLLLGLLALAMAVVWTFGFMGLAGIPFTQLMVAVPPLLLAVGIDFGIHAVNRYREERVDGHGIETGMFRANQQLLVAFFIVTGTTAIGFGANLTSDLPQIREFGVVTAIGVVFTLLVFGIFMPAAKVAIDRFRAERPIPEFGTTPLGDEDSALGRVLPAGLLVGRHAPLAMLLLILLATVGAGYVATDVETEFDDEDFLPYEEMPPHVDFMPGGVDPDAYRATEVITFLGDNFETGEDDQVTVFVEGPTDDDHVLESIHRAGRDPPGTVVTEDGQAVTESVLDPMEAYAEEDAEFAALIEENDLSGSGVPDRNVDTIFDELLASPEYGPQAENYVTEDRTAMRVIYEVEADADQDEVVDDIRTVVGDYRVSATATGEIVVLRAVTELLFASAIMSLATALSVTAVFLVVVYWAIERRPTLGLANLVPIVTTVAVLAGTMVVLGIPFNALTATILSITIGIGIAYSVHITHRFVDEFDRVGDAESALFTTLRGTGGGVTGSMITTTTGVGALVLSVTPLLGQFGLLTALSVLYSYLAALIVLPPTLLVWERYAGRVRPTDDTDLSPGGDHPDHLAESAADRNDRRNDTDDAHTTE